MAVLEIPKKRSVYRRDCIDGTEQSTYGRDSRVPIHDAVNYVVGMTLTMNIWAEAIGLCVENGKLCAIYNQ